MLGVRIPSCFMTTIDTIAALAVTAVGSWKAARNSNEAAAPPFSDRAAARLAITEIHAPDWTARRAGGSWPQISGRQQRQEPDAVGCEGIGAALLTVNHAQGLKRLGPRTTQARRRQHDLSAAGDHIQEDRLTLVDSPSVRSFTCSRTPPPRQLAAQSPKLKQLSQAFHVVIRRRLPQRRAGQSKMAQLTSSIRAAPVWCACLVRVDVAKKKAAVRWPVESVTL